MSTKAAPKSKPKKSAPAAVKAYLIAYNALSAAGWSYLLVLLIVHLFNLDGQSQAAPVPTHSLVKTLLFKVKGLLSLGHDTERPLSFLQTKLPPALQPILARATTAYARIGEKTTFVQSFAILEVLHAVLGWVRSPVVTTTMQVSSRLFLVWGITAQFAETHSNPIYASMVLAWSVTEVIRYTFYALNLLGTSSQILLWLRYTTFYVLYPLGASSEAFLILSTLPHVGVFPKCLHATGGSKPVSEWNVGQLARGVLFLIWWPGLYAMYTYMIGQRGKVLGAPKAKTL
ncbi:protein tyrosine phosphatase [Coprinopsis cinerea okayama7|uniref:Very-long-chain (3R)-3-hydroxyacyl-CoA dehydratase n=1 Tax=Coprinopsis cinerea (strain Okayama-7 / 130 / ATCC MYA-4618 / FGSC 9003) TaxID=240176 RepID=A8N6T0_COPC7|nr:protein tyrosine phosphatase [Coprinopsis cinerea okayama7\|eukprot:XP_001830536.1 protein tyrosine phosphatase [Coprinopsis cinerea okayama7\